MDVTDEEPDETRICRICGIEKSIAVFSNRDRSPQRRRECNTCRNNYAKEMAKLRDPDGSKRLLKARESRALLRQRRITEYLAKNPWPLCRCGCLKPTFFNVYGQLSKTQTLPGHITKVTVTKFDPADYLPNEDVRAAIRKLKTAKGWTWDEMGKAGGVSPHYLRNIGNGTCGQKQGHRREYIVSMLRRMSGMSEPPSAYELKQLAKHQTIYLPDGTQFVRVGVDRTA